MLRPGIYGKGDFTQHPFIKQLSIPYPVFNAEAFAKI